MKNIINGSLFFLAAGVFTSVTILGAYQILFAIPVLYYLYLAIRNKEFNLPKSAWWLIGFTIVAIISLIVNFELVPKPGKNFGRLKYFIYGFGGIFVFKFWLKEASDKTKKFILNVFLVSIIVAGLAAIYNFVVIDAKRAKSFLHTMRYGYGSAMILVTLLSALLHSKKIESWFDKRLGLAAFIIGIIGMYLTYTRGALLGFLCALPFVFYYYRPRLGLSLGGLALIGVLSLSGLYLFGSGKYGTRFLKNKNTSSDVIRRSQWKASVIATQEKPIWGWGLSNFHSQLNRIKIDYDLEAKHFNDSHSHNLFLEIASGTGLVGLFFFLGWLITWAREAFRQGGLVRALIVPFGVVFTISSQFEVTLDANNASMIFFIYAISSIRGERAVKSC